MSARLLSATCMLAVTLVTTVGPLSGTRRAAAGSSAAVSAQAEGTTTLDDQTELAVTVYNSDLALVRDIRNIRVGRGTSDLHFMDIAATVNPASVHFRSLSEPSRLNVLEQNYEYDLLEPEKLLRKYVGRDVILVRRGTGPNAAEEEVTARLLSYNSAPVWQIEGEIVTGMQADHIRFPELPGNLYSRPTLIWTLDNTGAATHRVEASYLATRLSWNADYVLTVARDDKSADIDGWVTLVNGSGTAFKSAKLQFVAGELNRVRQVMARNAESMAAPAQAPALPMSQEDFSDYHLYTLARKTSINNNETKQLSMLAATAFPVRKRYVVDGQTFYYQNIQRPGAPAKEPVHVYYEFRNEQRSGLGMPLPAGTVRVYQSDSQGGTQFVGEDHIGHTPKDEALNLKIGNAFDVTCDRKQIDFQRVSSNVYELEYELVLRNHKTIPIAVEINEPIGGSWRMLRSSHEWTKTAASAAQFTLPVPVDGTVRLTYRVRVTN